MIRLILQQNSREICVKKMILLVIFFTITFLKDQQLRAHTFLESVSLCIKEIFQNDRKGVWNLTCCYGNEIFMFSSFFHVESYVC